jgi:hypothetical protein
MSSILAQVPLVCHPDTPCAALAALGVKIVLNDEHGWDVEFVAMGSPLDLRLPAPTGPVQTEGLWHTTCFELFFALDGDAYVEMNLSPSCAWAAFHFDHYRTGMRPIDMPAPAISIAVGHERLVMSASLAEDALPWDRTGRMGISAVIEERSGAVSYWALAHPPGRPDFHHHDCFALHLPPVDRR